MVELVINHFLRRQNFYGSIEGFSKIQPKFGGRSFSRSYSGAGLCRNQAVKTVAIARGFVAPSGIDLICVPAFTDITIESEERTAIKLIVEPR